MDFIAANLMAVKTKNNYDHCWGKRVQQLKKRKKSCFLDFEKNVKKRKKTYI